MSFKMYQFKHGGRNLKQNRPGKEREDYPALYHDFSGRSPPRGGNEGIPKYKELYTSSAMEKLRGVKFFKSIKAAQRFLEKHPGGQIYTGIHSEDDWSKTKWYDRGFHFVNRSGEYAVIEEQAQHRQVRLKSEAREPAQVERYHIDNQGHGGTVIIRKAGSTGNRRYSPEVKALKYNPAKHRGKDLGAGVVREGRRQHIRLR